MMSQAFKGAVLPRRLTVADMFVVRAAVSCGQTVIGAVTAALCEPLLSAAQLGALPQLSWSQQVYYE